MNYEQERYIIDNLDRAYRLCHSVKAKYKHLDMEELKSICHEALCKAAIKYDISKGDFWAYAKRFIMGEFYDYNRATLISGNIFRVRI